MFNLENSQILFVVNSFVFQLFLIVHFSLRKWRFDLAIRYGRILYALSIPSAIVSIILFRGGAAWSLWLGGIIYLIWSIVGYTTEYILRIEWRNSLRWSVLIPYVILYLATVMFYLWPLALIYKPLWYGNAVLFLLSTYLNVTSHKRPGHLRPNEEPG